MHLATFIDPMLDEAKAAGKIEMCCDNIKSLMQRLNSSFEDVTKLLGLTENQIKLCKEYLEEQQEESESEGK